MLVLFVVYPIVHDRAGVVHELRRRHPHDQGGDGRLDRRLLGGADRRTRRATTSPSAPRARSPPGRSSSSWSARRTARRYSGTEDGLEELDERRHGRERPDHRGRRLHDPRRRRRSTTPRRRSPSSPCPTENGAIRAARHHAPPSRAPRPWSTTRRPTPSPTPRRHRLLRAAAGLKEYYVDEDGTRVSDQSWKANVGFANYKKLFTDPRIRSDFFRIFLWTFAFATLSVVGTFLMGLLFAFTLNDPRLRGQKIYRALLIIPYAIPGFISLLLWSSFYNRDFGLINEITGLNINWFGGVVERQVRRAAHQPVDGLPLHVPGQHRSPPGDPGGPHRGGQDRRRQRLQAASAGSSSRCCW